MPRTLLRVLTFLCLAAFTVMLAGPTASMGAEFDAPALSFHYSESAFGTPVVSPVSACPLEDPSDKPDGVSPAHLAVIFGSRGEVPADAFKECNLPNFERVEIRVFPVEAFVKVYKQAGPGFARLRLALDTNAIQAGSEVPFVPFVDAHSAFVEHVSFLRFQNGRGFVFLTQWMIEPDSIGKSLVYVFQGLTDDGRSYVLATIPLRSRMAFEPFPYRKGEPYEDTLKRHVPYSSKIATQVRKSTDLEFVPDLATAREMFRSIRIR